ncbi:hypothetical protein CEK29_00395 [Bordetella genomosp. 5]|uniref:DUF2970 domain-containing protein n=1 Tax=Bordetella genomosp. 5 TaxID=1395608 RepID=A0A261TZY5_9BORD|nr:DUF2970 domain-containing protein [Bordetella genomosp. 5]OZI47254.1 hypothetical protein CEK29_00395 [Bordetella genomosp. 5]OZI55189.1 hypothetical protein CAL25_01885 [Bordetella genomosp. 5]
MSDDLHQLSRRKLSFLQTVRAVLWAFFGVRKGKGYQEDIARLNPVHLIIAGLLGAAMFVIVLVLIVRFAVASLS